MAASAEESEVIRAPNWLRELEEKRERRLKGKLGHEAGAGSPCLECKERCPGLDLHFWRKICKNCKCGKENHDVQDDDMYGLLQIQQPKKNQKIVLPGRKEEVVLEWTPKGTQEALEAYFKDLPPEQLPIKGSSAAQERKQNLQKQFPIHDVDPTLCHALTEEETQQMHEYVNHLKENSVGVGQLIHIAPKKTNAKKHDYENIDAFGNHKLTAEIERLQLDEDVNLAVAQYALLLDKSSLPLRDRNGSPIKADLDAYNQPIFCAEVYEKIGPLAKAEYAILLDKNGAPILNTNDIPVKNSIVYKPPLGELCDKFGNKIYPQFALLLDKNRSVLKDQRFNSPIKVPVDVFGYPIIDRSLAGVQPEYACFLDRNGAVILENGKPVTLDLGEKAKFAMLLDKGRNLIDGPVIARLDAYGAPILDDGIVAKLNGVTPQFAVMLNAKREVIYDKSNEPVEHCLNVFTDKISDKFGNEIRPQFGLLLDKNEAPIKDATGSPIRVILDAFCRPVIDEATIEKVKTRTPEFVMFLDRNGAPILDKYGSPVKNVASSVKSSSHNPKFGLLLDQNEQVLNDYSHNPITVNLDGLNRAIIDDSIASEYKPRYSVLMDETNSPILDANGKAVKEDLLNRALGSKAKFATLLDKNRAPLRDAHGNPLQVHLDALARPVLSNSAQPKFAALLDSKGLPIFNEYGQVLQEIVDPFSKYHPETSNVLKPYGDSSNKYKQQGDGSNRYDALKPQGDGSNKNPDGTKLKYPHSSDNYDNYPYEGLNKLVDKYNNPINIDNATLSANGKPILDQYGVPMKLKVDPLGRVVIEAESPKPEELNQAVLTKQGVPLLDKFGTPLSLSLNGGALSLNQLPIYSASGAQIRAETAQPTQVNIGAIQDINYPTYGQRPIHSALKVQEAELAQFDEIESAQCHRCKQIFEDNALVIQIERSEALWHSSCFKCKGCNQNLTDLVYFFHAESNDVYCGRDFAKIRGIPRCNACDELIFVKEYCLAEHNTYHVKHFCCFECDSPLAGRQYVIENNQPVCIGCYENLKADKCNGCERIIKPDEQGANLNGTHFHADDECFACRMCRKPLLGGKFLFRNLRLYCSGACFNADQ